MEQRIKILPFPHKSHAKKDGTCPLRIRITTPYDEAIITPGIWIEPDSWNTLAKRCNKGGDRSRKANTALENTLLKIKAITDDLKMFGRTITGKLVKQMLENGDEVRPSILSYLQRAIREIEAHELKPKGTMSRARFKKYLTFQEKMKDFLETDKGRKYHFMIDLDQEFMKHFANWLAECGGVRPGRAFKEKGIKVAMPLAPDSVRSHRSLLKTICFRAVVDNVLVKNPYAGMKLPKENNSRPYLPKKMVDQITELEITGKPGVSFVRDMFIILCYTGMPWGDLETVTYHDFVDEDAQPAEVEAIYRDDADVFIFRGRNKNDEAMLTPVFPNVKALLRKYRFHKDRKGDKLVPSLSNKTFNEHLKEIGEMAGVHFKHMKTEKEKKAVLTSYVGRHTFATMMMTIGKVGSDVRLLANMMGHRTTTQAEHYARLLPELINEQSKNAYRNIMSQFRKSA